MKSSFSRSLMFVMLSVCAMIFLAGCQSGKPTEDQNKAMSAQQKAIIAEHKRQGEQ